MAGRNANVKAEIAFMDELSCLESTNAFSATAYRNLSISLSERSISCCWLMAVNLEFMFGALEFVFGSLRFMPSSLKFKGCPLKLKYCSSEFELGSKSPSCSPSALKSSSDSIWLRRCKKYWVRDLRLTSCNSFSGDLLYVSIV